MLFFNPRFSTFQKTSMKLKTIFATCLGIAVSNAQCAIKLPDNPLTAQGLATPFTVTGCDQTQKTLVSFAQGVIFDPNTNTLSVYNPLIINEGTQPAIMPTLPKIPNNAIISVYFGTNAGALKLVGPGVINGNCIQGMGASNFGQHAGCNGVEFFKAARNATIPPLGMATNGQPCLTTRDFALVDQDPSDNVNTQYLLSATNQLAQDTKANRAQLGGNATVLTNGSDNRLLAGLSNVIGCNVFKAPDLADPGSMLPALQLNELDAAKNQKLPIALVQMGNPMTNINAVPNLDKTNLYRLSVNQPNGTLQSTDTATFCLNYGTIAPSRIILDKAMTVNAPSPDPALANSLFTFLCQRFAGSFGPGGLNCVGYLNIPNPIALTQDANGVAIDCQFDLRLSMCSSVMQFVFSNQTV